MALSVLGSLSLGYRPLWNRSRELAGVQLVVHEGDHDPLDGQQLLRIIDETWAAESPQLFLSIRSVALLSALLEDVAPGAAILDIPLAALQHQAGLRQQVREAAARGVRMIASGPAGQMPPQDVARCFEHRLHSLSAQDAVAALQSAAARRNGVNRPSPVQQHQMYEQVASRALADHCLDQQGAYAVAGWPAEDVMHAFRYAPVQPSHRLLTRLLIALDHDASLEQLDQMLGEDPLLVYRLLTYVNSAAMGLRTGIGSIRHGLMMMGVDTLKKWLTEQLPHASSDADLDPIRQGMVLRARLTEALMEAGIEEDLRREVYLCGLFSQLDVLLAEPLGTILGRLPLSDRIHAATVLGTGPYAGALLSAIALESGEPGRLALVAAENELDVEDVQRGLLRMLASV